MLSELVTRPTIVSVYMRNNTSSCDKQTQQLQLASAKLDALGVGLIGLSKDTPGSHQKYACKLELDFPLVSDPDHAFAKAVKSLVEKKMYGKMFMGPTRSAYLIDPQGSVLGVIEKVDSANHAAQLLELAKALD
ncbi:antioxidant, AhpC/TSA family [Verrucomicrobiia bacterium DG1235]|nr:antioxidant, AhpC/TSA family [Verrucomicrobiae bacterium DG1235]